MKRIMLSLLTLLFCGGTSFSQSLNLPKGKTFEITRHHVTKGAYNNDELKTYAFRSLGKDAKGNFILETRIVAARADEFQTQKRQLNTDSVRKTTLNSPEPLFFLAMLNKPFKVVVSPQGKLISVEGVKEILNSAFKNWDIKPETQQDLLQHGKILDYVIADLFYQGGADKLSSRTNQDTKNTDAPFKLTAKNSSTVTMQSSKVTDELKQETKYVIDLNNGLIVSGLETAEIGADNSQQQVGEPKYDVITRTTKQSLGVSRQRKAPDTAWLNFAVKLSSWSKAYYKGVDLDSVKVYQLLKMKDPGYLNDPYFAINRLSLIFNLGDYSRNTYCSLLMLTPNRLLVGADSHLYNKLDNSLEKSGPDAAYEVSTYAIKTGALDRWIQRSMSQAFNLSQADLDRQDARLVKSFKLLDRFIANKDPKYQRLISPLYLWANTLRTPADTLGLIKAGKSLLNMNDEQMKAGNGGRYSLLIYQRLLAAKQHIEASKLLDATIEKFERYTADTLSTERYAYQNMLAGAYYLKYVAAGESGDPEYLTYLAKAAKYSPTGSKEKATASSYDRVFLKTKESYKEEYIEKMLSASNETEGFKMFTETINAMPESIEEMKKLFKQKFPDKDFKAFFNEEVVKTWHTAPSFAVKGVDGKDYQLLDYQDKWLVIDFWGTWCSPCVEEMPLVNKFAMETVEGRHPNVSFLSVACRDTEVKVKGYLAKNKFSMTAAMADGAIENAYAVTVILQKSSFLLREK